VDGTTHIRDTILSSKEMRIECDALKKEIAELRKENADLREKVKATLKLQPIVPKTVFDKYNEFKPITAGFYAEVSRVIRSVCFRKDPRCGSMRIIKTEDMTTSEYKQYSMIMDQVLGILHSNRLKEEAH
jgi:uncharacterized DUF497 family protein